MSQAGVITSGGGGGGGDIDQINTQNGNATPISNIIIIDGFDTDVNNIEGISTAGGVVGTGTQNEVDVLLTNRFHGTLTTTDASTQTLATLPITIANGVTRINVNVCGYNSTGNIAATVNLEASYRTTASSNTLLNNPYQLIQEDGAFVGTVLTDGTTPGSILVTVAGQAANTILWVCVGTYVQVGS